MSQRVAALMLGLAMVAGMNPAQIPAQQRPQSEEIQRRAKSKVLAAYPEIARRMNISGTVKVEVVVLPNGVVKDARVVGGHPVLANAALEAARKWRFEPAAMETTGVIDFKFEPH